MNHHHERGAALAIALVLLLAITLPVVALMRTTTVNEQVVQGTVDRTNTFQAAEAGLVEAEAFAATKPVAPANGACAGGICGTPTGDGLWRDPAFWNNAQNYREVTNAVNGIRPRYTVEFMGISTGANADCTTQGDISPDANCDIEVSRYRVTVRSRSASGSEVILQSNFLAP